MFQTLGPLELLIILLIVIALFGAGRIAGVGRALGTSVREFRREARTGVDGEDADDAEGEEAEEAEEKTADAAAESPTTVASSDAGAGADAAAPSRKESDG